jgi:alkaline phosphatase D
MTRREFLVAPAALRLAQRGAPAIVMAGAQRPAIPCGVASGDVSAGRAIIWSRTDRPARLIVEYSTSPSFRDLRRVVGPAALEDTDFTARIDLIELPSNQRISYRVQFQDLSDLRTLSEPVEGSFATPDERGDRDVTFAFSADTVGQGWGLDPAHGGILTYASVRRAAPDLFINLGDTIYADQPLQREVALDDGSVWRNVVTEAKSRVAETLEDFRGNHAYNHQDEHLRACHAAISQIVLWDDHEVHDNWYPTQRLDADARYKEKSVALLAARAKRAFFEYQPVRMHPVESERIYRSWRHGPLLEVFALDLRSYRGPNSANRQIELTDESAILGAAQVSWLESALASSTSTWKVIASDMPIGLVVPDAGGRFEAVANRDDGPPLGRELEIARVLKFIHDRRITNVVWITADVHYGAAHYYDPSRARFTEFSPFWEFVSGPLHAGTFGPNDLDRTFGPEVRFLAIPPGMKPNRPPSDGYQFFGFARIDHRTKALAMEIRNRDGQTLFAQEIPAATERP